MADSNLNITFNIVWWFFNEEFGFFTCDDLEGNEEGVIHQLYAQNMGWA